MEQTSHHMCYKKAIIPETRHNKVLIIEDPLRQAIMGLPGRRDTN